MGDLHAVGNHDRRILATVSNMMPARAGTMPTPITRIIGREAEIVALARVLAHDTARLLTVTGAGGSGKTRLALAVASAALDLFPDGVYFVDLSPVTDGAMVPQAIAAALGVREALEQPIRAELARFLAGRRLLLLLDNCEHVLDAMPDVAALLATHPALSILATSREPLRIRGEREFPLPPLSVPDLEHLPDIDGLATMPAVALFVERAVECWPDFRLTSENAPSVAAICQRLDGLPLALELAASWVKALSPAALLERLEPRLPLLASGARDLPSRHRTMRDAISWSYGLLDPPQQLLYRRLSVFSGGCVLSAVQHIGGEEEHDDATLNVLGALINKSLVLRKPGGTEDRYSMLETIREYGLECLHAHGEAARTRERHAQWCLAFAEQASREMRGPHQQHWLARLDAEYDNARTALEWMREHGSVLDALQLGASYAPFWLSRARLGEGRKQLDALLTLTDADTQCAARAEVLLAAARLAEAQSDFSRARMLTGEALVLWRDLGDRRGMARSLLRLAAMALTPEHESAYAAESLEHYRAIDEPREMAGALADLAGMARDRGDLNRARTLLDESVDIYRTLGNRAEIAWPLACLGLIAWYEGNDVKAQALFTESQTLFQSMGDLRGQTWATHGLGLVAWTQGDLQKARTLHERALASAEQTGDRREVALLHIGLGFVAEASEDTLDAQRWFFTALITERELGNTWGIALCLEGLAGLLVHAHPQCTARLIAAADAARVRLAEPLPPVYRSRLDQVVLAAQSRLGETAFASAWATGSDLTLEQAITDALAVIDGIGEREQTGSALPTGSADTVPAVYSLTSREREILRLLGQRATDREIAAALSISPRTVMHHVSSILAKLGAANRREAGKLACRL